MQTANDVDLELIFSLGEVLEKKCESRYHDTHQWGHSDGSILWYAKKVLSGGTNDCTCDTHLMILCDGFVTDSEQCQGEYGYFTCCDCGGFWRIQRLEPV